MKFKPLLPDLGMKAEIRCHKCKRWTANIDKDSGLCRDCFQENQNEKEENQA